MKICKDCKVEKTLNDFYKNGKFYRRRCRKCHNLKFRPPKGASPTRFTLGNVPWNKGLRNTGFKPANGFKKGSTINKGRKKSTEWIVKIAETRSANATSRTCKKHQIWKKVVWERDNYECTKCGSKKLLIAHHIKTWNEYPDLRFDIDNGLTLCCSCHSKHHGHGFKKKHVN